MSLHQSHLIKSTKSNEPVNSPHQSQLHRNYKRGDSDIQRVYLEIKKVKYPVLAVEPAEPLQNKISRFENEKLQNQMKIKLVQDRQLNAYRKIRGDGNCFIRALAYSYLSNVKDLDNVRATFYELDQVDLTTCLPQSIPKEFKPFYNDRILKQILINNWEIDVKYFRNLCRDNSKRILSRMFRRSPYLDFIVILYFRCLCLKGLEKHKQEVKDFMKGTQEEEIKTYGSESEGVILDICSRLLKVSIDVYEVRKQDLNHYGYRNQKIIRSQFNVSLLFYQSHYDILQSIQPKLLEQQRNDTKIQQEQYYSKINESMVEGNCIECGKEDYIYEENYLCEKCFEISRQQMLNSTKDNKWVRGVCRDCGRSGLKVLEMISLCEECANMQAAFSQQDLKRPSPKRSTYECNRCYNEVNQDEECSKCVWGMCIQCREKDTLDKETKLCRQCKELIQKEELKNTKKQEYQKSKCQICKEPTDSYFHLEKCQRKKIQICHYCNETKDSQIHMVKCVNKLTAGKILLSKTEKPSYYQESKQERESRTCRKCNLERHNEVLVHGWCKKCRDYFLAEDRHKGEGSYFGTGNIISESSHRIEDDRRFGKGESCRGCKNHFYATKLKNGYCPNCDNFNGYSPKF